MTSPLAQAILNGNHDADIDAIEQAIATRRAALGTSKVTFESLKVGDRVRISPTAKPTYLRGLPATITKKNRTRVVIDLDAPAGRFHTNITAPPSLLDLETEAA